MSRTQSNLRALQVGIRGLAIDEDDAEADFREQAGDLTVELARLTAEKKRYEHRLTIEGPANAGANKRRLAEIGREMVRVQNLIYHLANCC